MEISMGLSDFLKSYTCVSLFIHYVLYADIVPSISSFLKKVTRFTKNWAYQNSWTLDGNVGRWTLDSGCWTLDTGLWRLASGPWTLVVGFWTLVSGHLTLHFAELWTPDSVVDWFKTELETTINHSQNIAD